MNDKDDFTLFVGNIAPRVTEEILFELFLQAGPIDIVKIPQANGKPRGFGFVTFKHKCSVPYALELMDGIQLYGRPLQLQTRRRDQQRARGPRQEPEFLRREPPGKRPEMPFGRHGTFNVCEIPDSLFRPPVDETRQKYRDRPYERHRGRDDRREQPRYHRNQRPKDRNPPFYSPRAYKSQY